MTETVDLTREVQQLAAGQARPAGNQVPATTGTQSPGVATSRDGAVQQLHPPSRTDLPDRDYRGPVMAGGAHDFGWRPQDRFEAKAYRETFANLGDVASGGIVTLDPNLATNFIVTALGTMTVQIAGSEAPPELDDGTPQFQYLTGIKLWVKRPIGAQINWNGVKWPVDVLDPDGDGATSDSLLGPATKGEYDSYVIVIIPGFGTFGYLAGRGY